MAEAMSGAAPATGLFDCRDAFDRQEMRDRTQQESDRQLNDRTKADTEFLAREIAGVRLAMGDVVIGDLLKERGLHPAPTPAVEVFIAGVTDDDLPHVLSLAHECRDAGLRTEYALTAQAVGKQLKLADARQARVAVLIGPDDRARNEVQIKDLTVKAQRSVSRTDAVAALLAARS